MLRHVDASRDAAACAEIYEPFVRDSAVSFEEQTPDVQEMERRITQISASHPWLVGEIENRVVGFTYASAHRARAAYRWAAEVTVYVGPGHRRRGLGRALYAALFQSLREQGMYVACAGITLPNDASVGLHESLGFQPVGVYRNIGWKAGAWHDVGWWQLELRPAGGPPPSDPVNPSQRD